MLIHANSIAILGFLNANVDRFSKSPANYGLMDVLAALHWIQENIEAFGGDNKSVTLAGHGTGAACVHFLIASQAVPDGLLFHRAILMSGSGLAPWSLVGDPAHYAAIVAHHVNCSVDLPHQALMKCLRDVPLKSLLSTPIRMPEFGNAFGPSVDGVVIGEFTTMLRVISIIELWLSHQTQATTAVNRINMTLARWAAVIRNDKCTIRIIWM